MLSILFNFARENCAKSKIIGKPWYEVTSNLFLHTLTNTVNSSYLLRDLASLAVPEDLEEVDVIQVRGKEKVIQLEKPRLFSSTHFLATSRRLFYWCEFNNLVWI